MFILIMTAMVLQRKAVGLGKMMVFWFVILMEMVRLMMERSYLGITPFFRPGQKQQMALRP